MRYRLVEALIAALVLGFAIGCATRPASDGHSVSSVQQEILVTIVLADSESMEELGRRLQREYTLRQINEWPLKTLGVHCFVFRVSNRDQLAEVMGRMKADPRVESVQPMQLYQVLSNTQEDTYRDLQHGLRTLRIAAAHRWATGKGVRVGVVDTAIDENHQDLRQQVVQVKSFVGDEQGKRIVEAHGTAVAGVIAAQAYNGVGIIGVAPDAALVGLRGCWQLPDSRLGQCSSFTLARAINFAVLNDIDVLNLSLQGPHDPLLARLLERAMDEGTIVVAAYQPQLADDFPASLPGVIAVTDDEIAITDKIKREGENGIGTQVAAPGVDILTTVPNDNYDFISGSSMAAAHVSGVVALIIELAPDLAPNNIAHLLQTSSKRFMESNKDSQSPTPINACRSLAALQNEPCMD